MLYRVAQWCRTTESYNEASASTHLVSALLISSSYTVHANAELIAFLPALKPNPSNKLLTPSSLTILLVACTIFAYLPGISCSRVLTASNGFVTAVASPAAMTPDTKLMETDEPTATDPAASRFFDCS